MDQQRQIVANGLNYQEEILSTDNTRLASIFYMFGAALLRNCPLEWVDIHRSRETYLRNLEDPSDPEYQPKPKVTFNFQKTNAVPASEIVEAFRTEFPQLYEEFEALLPEQLSETDKDKIRMAVSRLITRACHESFLKREELVRLLKRVPQNAKFDQIKSGRRIVRLGKNCSPETRSHYLSKLPADE